MDLNSDAPNSAPRLPPATNALTAEVRAAYPADLPCLFMKSIHVPTGKTYANFLAVHLIAGFDAICTENNYIELVGIAIRIIPKASGVIVSAGLTINASASHSMTSINNMKSMISRRVTDLTAGAETCELLMHTGVSKMLRPAPISGFYPYLALNITGESSVAIEISYYRGGGAITTAEYTVT